MRDVSIPHVYSKRRDRATAKFSTYDWLVIVNQDCDLDLDHHARHGTSPQGSSTAVAPDKMLRNVLVCPAFPEEHVLAGTYLPFKTHEFRKSARDAVIENRHERFHRLAPEAPFVLEPLIIDFKLVFGCVPEYLERWSRRIASSRVAVLVPPWRDRLTQRFANYFVRIAEPVT